MRPHPFVVIAAVLIAAAPSAAGAPIVHGPLGERIDTYMTRAAAHGMAAALLVESNGAIVLNKGYGLADREHRVAITEGTPFEIGSLGKQFTATAILHLEGAGKLRTTDTLGRFIPWLSPPKSGITIDQLLHHTAGLGYLGHYDFFAPMPDDSLLHAILDPPLEFAPGDHHQYSSPGYDLLARIVERASGMSFQQYVHRHLFEPAGMTHTGFLGEWQRWSAIPETRSYSGSSPEPPLISMRDEPAAIGAGMVVSTTGDLWRWELALREGRVLPPAQQQKLFSPAVVSGPTTHYAAGWMVARSQRNTTVVMHAGDLGGFNADMRRLVDEHATIIVLSNTRIDGRGCREPVALAVTKLLFDQPLDLPPARVGVSREWLEGSTGQYRLPSGALLDVAVDGNGLRVSSADREGLSILAGSDSAGRATEQRLQSRARLFVESLLNADRAALDTLWHPSMPGDGRAAVADEWRRIADSLGASPEIEVLGTASVPPAGGRTFVRLRGANGARVLTLSWAESRAIDSGSATEAGMAVQFVPDTPASAASYGVISGRLIRIARAPEGRDLTVESGGRAVEAVRL